MTETTEAFVVRNHKQQPYIMIERVIAMDKSFLDVYDKAVYGALCGFACNDTQQAYPSRTKLSEICRCSTDRVDKSLKNLVDHSLLKMKRRQRENGSNTSNIYTLTDIPVKFYDDSEKKEGGSRLKRLGVAAENDQGSRSERLLELESLELLGSGSSAHEESSDGTPETGKKISEIPHAERLIGDHYLSRKQAFVLSPMDAQAIGRVIKLDLTLAQVYDTINALFDDKEQNEPWNKINSFKYIEPVLARIHHESKQQDKPKKRTKQQNKNKTEKDKIRQKWGIG